MKSLLRAPTGMEIEQFNRDGAVLLKGIIHPDWVSRLRERADRRLELGRVAGTYCDKQGGFFQESLVWQQDSTFEEFILSSEIGSVPAALLKSGTIRLFEDTLLIKEPRCTRETPWHQDMPYYSLGGTQLCTTWIPFDPVSSSNGTLRFVRGSHLWGRKFRPVAFTPGNTLACDDYEPVETVIAHLENYQVLTFDYEPGDMSVHHALTLHGAFSNEHASLARRAYAVSFAGDDIRAEDRTPKPKFLVGIASGEPLSGYQFPLCKI